MCGVIGTERGRFIGERKKEKKIRWEKLREKES